MEIFTKFIKRIPLNIQEYYIESVILSIKIDSKTIYKTLQNNVMTYFKPFIHLIKDTYISSFLLDSDKILRCLNPDTNKWSDCDDKLYKDFKNIKIKSDELFLENKYGYYGIDTNENLDNINDFKIRDVRGIKSANADDKRLIKMGMKCTAGWKKPTLLPLIRLFKLEYPNDYLSQMNKTDIIEYMKNTVKINKSITNIDLNSLDLDELKRISFWTSKTQNELCSSIKQWLKENDLLKIEL
jgi:hypothetical protein